MKINFFQKKVLLGSLIIVIGLFFVLPNIVRADYKDEINTQLGAVAGEEGANFGTPEDPRMIIVNIIKTILGIMGILVTVTLIYGGFLFLSSGGQEEKITKGKKTILYSVIGVMIILSAYGIVLLVVRILFDQIRPEGLYVEPNYSNYYNKDPLSHDDDNEKAFFDNIWK